MVLARSPAHVVIFFQKYVKQFVLFGTGLVGTTRTIYLQLRQSHSDIVCLVRWYTMSKALFKSMKTPHVNCRLSIFL